MPCHMAGPFFHALSYGLGFKGIPAYIRYTLIYFSTLTLIYISISRCMALSYWVNPEQQVVRFPGACVIYRVYSVLYQVYAILYLVYAAYTRYMTKAPWKPNNLQFWVNPVWEGHIPCYTDVYQVWYTDVYQDISEVCRKPLENQAIWQGMENGPAIWQGMENCPVLYLVYTRKYQYIPGI